jgi:hypothetical protein
MSLFGPAVAARIRERMLLIEKGKYRRADGKPDVRRFCFDHRYAPTLVYYWLGNRSTPVKDLARLAVDLKTTPEFLLFGADGSSRKRPRQAP